jgi:hypothetical protein
MRIDWTDDKLHMLSQEQLLSLLDNLDRQRAIGRIPFDAAQTLDRRISALLTGRNGAKRRKQLEGLAASTVGEPQ